MANYNELMWGTYIDPYQIFSKLGPELHFIPYSQLQEETQAVSDSRATEYMQQLKANYTVESDVDESKFLESARASMGMANIVTGMEIDTLALNDVDSYLFKIIGLRPGFYHPSIGANHSVAVPEGDLGAALITYILKLITNDHVNFIEPFYIEGYSGCFTAGHAGPNDYTAANCEKYVRIAVDVRFAKTSYKYAGAPFAWYRIPPGKKTIAHFSSATVPIKSSASWPNRSKASISSTATAIRCSGPTCRSTNFSSGCFRSAQPNTSPPLPAIIVLSCVNLRRCAVMNFITSHKCFSTRKIYLRKTTL